MEILIFIVALLLVGGVSSTLHGIIKPAVDWVYPPVPDASPPSAQDRLLANARRKRATDRVLLVLLAAGIVGSAMRLFGII